jgi:dihydroorotase
MSELDIPLCVHGESDGFVMDRESEFMDIYENLATAFPKLKIVMEHITTKAATKIVQKYDNLYATITAHHLLLTLDDVVGGYMHPHLFCKPIAKRYEDRDALIKLATSGYKKVMFGSDSAPHPTSSKECCGCAAGVFTAPIAIQMMAELFIQDEKNINQNEQNLQKFLGVNAMDIYGISPPNKTIVLQNKEFMVPQVYKNKYHQITPMKSGENLKWRIR